MQQEEKQTKFPKPWPILYFSFPTSWFVKLSKEVFRSLRLLLIFCWLLAKLLLNEGRVIGVEAEHYLPVPERVLLEDGAALGLGRTHGCAENALDFRRVDQSGEVGLRDNVGWEEEVLLEFRGLGGGAVDLVESLEGSRGPDDKAAQVATRSQLEEVEAEDRTSLNARDVPETFEKIASVDFGVVDDKRTTALSEAAASHLALAGAHCPRVLDFAELATGADSVEEGNGLLGLAAETIIKRGRIDNKRDLGNRHDLVSASHQQGGNTRGGYGRACSKPPRIGQLCSDGARLGLGLRHTFDPGGS